MFNKICLLPFQDVGYNTRATETYMTRSDLILLKRVGEYRSCRVSQVDGPRGSAAATAADSDGKNDILNE